jgi:outer membrane lipoprotein-sorting protein
MIAHAADATVDSVIAKSLKATGGKAALEKIKTRTIKAVIEAEGMAAGSTFELVAKAPNLLGSRVELAGLGTIEDGFDGKTAWNKSSFGGTRLKSGDELAKTKRDAEFHTALKLKQIYPDLALKGTSKVKGEDAHVLESKPTPTSTERIYISEKTGLTVRQESIIQGEPGEVKTVMDTSDHRAVDGIMMPHLLKMSIATPDQTYSFTVIITEVKHNVAVPDSRFAKPAE